MNQRNSAMGCITAVVCICLGAAGTAQAAVVPFSSYTVDGGNALTGFTVPSGIYADVVPAWSASGDYDTRGDGFLNYWNVATSQVNGVSSFLDLDLDNGAANVGSSTSSGGGDSVLNGGFLEVYFGANVVGRSGAGNDVYLTDLGGNDDIVTLQAIDASGNVLGDQSVSVSTSDWGGSTVSYGFNVEVGTYPSQTVQGLAFDVEDFFSGTPQGIQGIQLSSPDGVDFASVGFTSDAAEPFVLPAGAVYEDRFDRPAGGGTAPLEGSAPNVRPGSETWDVVNAGGTGWDTDGSVLQNTIDQDKAVLPWSPAGPGVYALNVSVDVPDGASDTQWMGVGFRSAIGGEPWENIGPWMLLRSTGRVTTFASGTDATRTNYDGYDTGWHELMIELDTTGAQWTATYYIDGEQKHTDTYTTNPAISYLALVSNDLSAAQIGYFDNFRLEVPGIIIPEPSTFLIWSLGLVGLAWCARRRRTK